MELLTNTALSTFRQCEMKYGWRYHAQIEKAGSSKPLRFGTAFHLGLDSLLSTFDIDVATARIFELYARHAGAFTTEDELAVERQTVAALVVAWWNFWGWEFGPEGSLVLEGSEETFSGMRIKNPWSGGTVHRYRLAGKIDRRVRQFTNEQRSESRLLLWEHKTTSDSIDPTSPYWLRLRLDPQISLYWNACKEHLGQVPDGIIYDVTRKPQIRPSQVTKTQAATLRTTGTYFGVSLDDSQVSTQRETPAMYAARLVATIAEQPDRYFGRIIVPRLESELAWSQAQIFLTQQRIAAARRTGSFLRNESACISSFGRCPFLPLCSAGMTPGQDFEPPEGYVRLSDPNPELSISEEE